LTFEQGLSNLIKRLLNKFKIRFYYSKEK